MLCDRLREESTNKQVYDISMVNMVTKGMILFVAARRREGGICNQHEYDLACHA